MKRLSLTLLAFLMVAANVAFAQTAQTQTLNASQVAKLDLNGKWSGKRNQYSWDKKSFIETFQYEFDLKQEGNTVTGTSTIMTANGEYADMKLEGVIMGNKLYFREFEVQNAIRPDGKVWCFKSGELSFTKDGDNLKLTGATPSYMETYNYPCSGGETDIKKVDNSANVAVLTNATPAVTAGGTEPNITINAFPNPFIDNVSVAYTLVGDSKVNVQVYDISGKLVTGLFEGSQKAGSYTYSFSAKTFGSMSGIYVVKMTVNGEVYSKEMVQMR